MTSREELVHQLDNASGLSAPAVRQALELLSEKSVEISHAPSPLRAEELASIWSIRMWNSVLKARRIVGLRDFVRTLIRLSPDTPLRQTAVRLEDKTALLFSRFESNELIGLVISTPKPADRENSSRNLSFAKGVQAPSFLAPQSHQF